MDRLGIILTRRNKEVFVLVFFTIAFCLFVISRAVYAQTLHKLFLIWNLFLAWVPFLALLPLYKKRHWFIEILLLVVWFIFLPNTLYTITDLQHIRYSSSFILYWMDIFALFAIATLGTWLALISLDKGWHILKTAYGEKVAHVTTIGAIILSGFGVYLGRFPRLNSWHLFSDPISVSKTITEGITQIAHNHYYFFFVCLFSGCYALAYLMYRKYKTV